MSNSTIKPEKITKPIQLLGAWLAGLFSIDACFLFAATNMTAGSWESSALTLAAIANVPVFLIAVFVLQTKFRPELQEDSYYSSYLSSKTNQPLTVHKDDVQFAAVIQRIAELENRITSTTPQLSAASEDKLQKLTIGINKFLLDKSDISNKLSALGITSLTTFAGTTPAPGRNVSISRYLPKDTIKEVVKLARGLGFESYNLYDNFAEESIEDVLLGSYGTADYQIAD
jgi:hypothetical protein